MKIVLTPTISVDIGEPKMEKQRLIDQVIEQIKTDVENQDMTAIEELLRFVPDEYLSGFLSEETK